MNTIEAIQKPVLPDLRRVLAKRHAEAIGVALLLLTILLFDCLTMRQGHPWGDDFAMYVHHAENLARNSPYADTGYIYNQREAWYGPRVYPPVFPLLLAPVIKLAGVNFSAMKLEQIALFCGCLLLIYILARKDMPAPYAATLVAVLAFNPTLWDLKDGLTSDFAFWLFLLLLAWVMERSWRNGRNGRISGVLAGILLYLCYGTRSIGLLLVPGVLLYEGLKYRRLTAFLSSTLAVGTFLIAAQHLFISTEASYAEQFHTGLWTILYNTRDYASILAAFWPWSAGRWVAYAVFAVFTAFAGMGAWRAIRCRGIRPLDCLLPCYVCFLLVWPGTQGMRFALPILPLYFIYGFYAFETAAHTWRPPLRRTASAAFIVLIAGLYLGDFRKRNFAVIPEATGRPAFNELCAYVRREIPRNAVVVFRYARALSLFTDRAASVYFLDGDPSLFEEQWRYFRQIHASYIIYSPMVDSDRDFLKPVLDQHSEALVPVFRNQEFGVFRLRLSSER